MLSEQSEQRARQAPGLPWLSDYRRTQSRLSQTRPGSSSSSSNGGAALELNGLSQVNSIALWPPSKAWRGEFKSEHAMVDPEVRQEEKRTSVIQGGRLVFSETLV